MAKKNRVAPMNSAQRARIALHDAQFGRETFSANSDLESDIQEVQNTDNGAEVQLREGEQSFLNHTPTEAELEFKAKYDEATANAVGLDQSVLRLFELTRDGIPLPDEYRENLRNDPSVSSDQIVEALKLGFRSANYVSYKRISKEG